MADLVTFPSLTYYDIEELMLDEEPDDFFPVERDSNWGGLRQVIASILQENLEQSFLIYLEAHVGTSIQYLQMWEAMMGLPVNPDDTVADRQAAVFSRTQKELFSRARIVAMVESFIIAQLGGTPVALTPAGVPFDAGGIPLFSGIADADSSYRIVEDVIDYSFNIRVDSAITLTSAFDREMKRITPGGITFTSSSHANPGVTTNLCPDPQFDTDVSNWEAPSPATHILELSQEQVFAGANSMKVFPRSGDLTLCQLVSDVTLTNNPCEVQFRMYLPSQYPNDLHNKIQTTGFTNNLDDLGLPVRIDLRDQWQLVRGYWTPGADVTGKLLLLNDAAQGLPAFNSLTNSSFESGTTDWFKAGANTIAADTAEAFHRTNSAKCTFQDNRLLIGQTEVVKFLPYEFNARVWIPLDWDGEKIQLQARDYTGAGFLEALIDADMNFRDDWQELIVEWKTPSSADLTGTFAIRCEGTLPTAGKFIYVDFCESIELPEKFFYVDDVSIGVLA